MKLYVISTPFFFKNEIETIITLFNNGLECLHFRKPKSDIQKCRQILTKIPVNYRAKIVIHEYSQLAIDLNLKGVHSSTAQRITGKTLSKSCHTFTEVAENLNNYDYLFISSLFDSISKHTLKSTFTLKEIEMASEQILTNKIVALGGISVSKIKILDQFGFKNAAILGYLWNDFLENSNLVMLVDKFLNIQNECKKYD